MKKYLLKFGFLIILILFPGLFLDAQSLETVQAELKILESRAGYEKDTAYLNKAIQVGFFLGETNPDSAFVFLSRQLLLCQKAKFKRGEAEILKIYGNAYQNKGDFQTSIGYYNRALDLANLIHEDKIIPGILNNIGLVYYNLGNYAEALNTFFEALKGAEKLNNTLVRAAVLNNIASIYFDQGKLDEAETYFSKVLALYSSTGNKHRMILAYNNLGDLKLKQKKPAEALGYLNKGYAFALEINTPDLIEMTARTLASIYVALDSSAKAEDFYRKSISIAGEKGYGVPYTQSLIGLAGLLHKQGRNQEALGYAEKALAMAEMMKQTLQLRNVHELLAAIYEADGNIQAALNSFRLFKRYSDTINSIQAQKVAVNYEAEYKLSVKTIEFEKESIRQQWLIFSGFAAFFSIGIILFITARNRNRVKKAYIKLQEKSNELEGKNEMLEKTLHQLKTTQIQLIHAEKMASLGEITTGIAHEIKNPLNFINNFSELNEELIGEVIEGLRKENSLDLLPLLNDIRENEAKIIHHGKRADAIVKAMIAHSRSGPEKRMPTDLVNLVKEYARVAYQGFKTKDLNFVADYRIEADPDLPRLKVDPQNFGRVLFNLLNNAFYAVRERQKTEDENYKPLVRVVLKKKDGKLVIKVRDNGPGIPEAIRTKIFQPFFTTKPTGQGTGLGLSLCYDIVKSLGGDLLVESKEALTQAGTATEGDDLESWNEGSEFSIQLPIT